MAESIGHHCALAAMQVDPKSTISAPSVVETLIRRQWNRGGAGWGLKGVIEGEMKVEAGGTDRTTLCDTPQDLSPREAQVTSVIGHGRYVTSGPQPRTAEEEQKFRQPFLFEAGGLEWAFCFNGTIANYPELKTELEIDEPDVDTEAIRRILIEEINARKKLLHKDSRTCMTQVFQRLEERLDGCFNIILISNRDHLFVYRDRHGFRPVVKSETQDEDVVIASEDSAIKSTFEGVTPMKNTVDIKAGQLFASDCSGQEFLQVMKPEYRRCFFEYVYFARDLSTIDGLPVRLIREAFGEALAAQEIKSNADLPPPSSPTELHSNTANVCHALTQWIHFMTAQTLRKKQYQNAVCIGVPESGADGGKAFARFLGMRYQQLIERRPGSERSFTQGQSARRTYIAETKFDIDTESIRGKDVYIVEDSMVRGTTMSVLVQKLKSAGAKSIHLRIACPAIIAPCFYGIDFPTINELLLGPYRQQIIENGGKLTPEIEKRIAEELGINSVKYLPVDSLLAAFDRCGMPSNQMCTACVKGTAEGYPTEFGCKRFEEELRQGTDPLLDITSH